MHKEVDTDFFPELKLSFDRRISSLLFITIKKNHYGPFMVPVKYKQLHMIQLPRWWK